MRAELKALTGVRAIASATVVLCHLIGQYPAITEDTWPQHVLHFGSNGVDLFFMLSGFIIGYSYHHVFADTRAHAQAYLDFLRKRLARLLPAHLFALTLMLLLGALLTIQGTPFLKTNPPGEFLAQLLLVMDWDPRHEARLSWNVPAWSISSEWLAYLLFPGVLYALSRVPRRALPTVFLGLPVLMACSYALGPANYGMIRILTEFPAGVALYLYWRGLTPAQTRVWTNIGTVCAVLYLPAGVLLGLAHLNVRWAVTLVPALLLALACGQGTLPHLLARPVPEYLGRVSYSLYITHYVVLAALRFTFFTAVARNSVLVTVGLTVIELLVIAGVAQFTYRYVEEPGRRWLTRRSARVTAAA